MERSNDPNRNAHQGRQERRSDDRSSPSDDQALPSLSAQQRPGFRFSAPRLKVIENSKLGANDELLPAPPPQGPETRARESISNLRQTMPWTGLHRALHGQSDSEGTHSAGPLQSSRPLEEQWAALLRGERLPQGHPLRQLNSQQVLIPADSGKLIGAHGRDLGRVRDDVLQYGKLMRSLLANRPDVPREASELIEQFQSRLLGAGASPVKMAKELGISPAVLVSGKVYGVAVTDSVAGALDILSHQLRSGYSTFTPVLAGRPSPGLSNEKLSRTTRTLGVYVGIVPRLPNSVDPEEVKEAFQRVKDAVQNGISRRSQGELQDDLSSLIDRLG